MSDRTNPTVLGHGDCGGAEVVTMDTVTIRTPVVLHDGRAVVRGDDGLPPWLETWFERRASYLDDLQLVCTSCGLDVARDELVPVTD